VNEPTAAAAVAERDRRSRALSGLGAPADLLDELLAYGRNPYREIELPPGFPPLAEEPQVPFWRRYAAQAATEGVAPALSRRFPQLRFPVRAGVSGDDAYRAATRRGAFDRERPEVALDLERPEALALSLAELPAGPVPVLVAPARADFETLVRAFTCRNEPEAVPASMGACLIKGLADWERVAAYRADWARRRGGDDDEAWQAAMGELAQVKDLWQDRLILLSTGPYSAVPAAEVGLDEAAWREKSVAIRLAHEGFHYLTLRLCGRIRSNLLDELLADFAGLVAAFGTYREDLARRFLGVDLLPELRVGGRLAVYRGDPPLSDRALEVVARLGAAATRELARIELTEDERRSPAAAAALLVALARVELESYAGDGLGGALAVELGRVGAGRRVSRGSDG
jgi:hypothetical protein